MHPFNTIWRWLRSLGQRRAVKQEIDEELRFHIEQRTAENIAAGMSPEEAARAARKRFGNVQSVREACRETRWTSFGETTVQDARFGLRMLRKNPGFTVAAVLTLALGIGFVTTLFTMINGVAFGRLPFEDAQRIVSIDVPAGQFDDFAARQQSCETLSFVQPLTANIRAETFVSRYPGAIVSANFLDVLRVRPVIGRGFLQEDALAGATRTALIGHTIWEREFERSADVSGREIRINGDTYTIVGVMPDGFGFPFHQEIWMARRAAEPIPGGLVFGRMHPGVSIRRAADQFTALARSLTVAGPGTAPFVWDANKNSPADVGTRRIVEVVPFAERSIKQSLRIMLSAILGATFLVLLLACANVANLVLARAVDRRKELAVRAALGAGRVRLIRQMLTESLVVAALGAIGGFAIAVWSTRLVWAYMMKESPLTGGAPFWINFDVDGRVFLFVAAVTLLASFLTGLVPALQASRVDLNDALKEGSGAGRRVSRFTRILVNAQMAFSVCLVTVAGLFVTVLIAFNQKILPYNPAAILSAHVSLDEKRYDDPALRIRFFEQLVSRLNTVPEVDAAALNSTESLRLTRSPRIELEGAVYAGQNDRPVGVMESVSANFLEGFGVGLLTGRTFTAADAAASLPVAVVNTAFAERFGREGEVVGRRFRMAAERGGTPSAWITVVGVAPDLGSMKAGEASRGPVFYRPLAQQSDRAMTILVRGRGDVSRFATAIRREVAAVDADMPVARLQTVQQIIEMERVGMNAFGTLFVICGLGALLLASVGIYGVISFGVKLRTREFGVRMALGADRSIIVRTVFLQGVRQISIGLGVGVLMAVGASALLSSMFVGLGRSGYDLGIYVGVVALLAVVAGTALLIPSLRASRVHPMTALRCD